MRRQSTIYWVYVVVFALHAIGFVISDFRDDLHKMVWYGFMGILWYRLADGERVTE